MMSHKFSRKNLIKLSAEITPILDKLNKCYSYKDNFQKELLIILSSEKNINNCLYILNHDFASESSLMQSKDIVFKFSELFNLLYCRHLYSSLDIESTYQKLALPLKENIMFANSISGRTWVFLPKEQKIKANISYQAMLDFKKSSDVKKIEAFYQRLYSSQHPNLDKILSVYLENRTEWNQFIVGSLKDLNIKPSVYLQNSEKLISCFEKIASNSFSDENFEYEFERYKNCVKELVIQETTKNIVSDIHFELMNMPVENLNNDGSSFKINILQEHGLLTFEDLYRAPVDRIESINGFSRKTANRIKCKVNEIVDLLKSDKQNIRKPLKLNFDSHSEIETEIVKAIYSYKRLLKVRDLFSKMEHFDNYELETSVNALKLFQLDASWLFLEDDKKKLIVKSYKFLKSLLEDERFKAYSWFLKYNLDALENIDPQAAWNDFKENSIEYYNHIEHFVPNVFEEPTFAYGLPEELAEQIDKEIIYPEGLTCELRRYQVWGVKFILHQMRSLLGDEMGLGKTIQAIASMVSLKNVGFNHFVVICPASVVVNWFKEIGRHSKLQAYIGHGSNKREDAVKSWKYYGGVLITTYETYPTLDISDEDLMSVGMVVVDEAHYIKNPDATRSKNIRALCGKVERVLFLTGTAIENNVYEMLSLLSVLNSEATNNARKYANLTTSQHFKNAISIVYFRRKQCDVIKELPEKIEKIDWCQMNQEEYDAYDEVILNYNNPFMPMRRVSWNVSDIRHSSKAQALKNIVEEAINDNRKVIVFSYFRETLDRVRQLFAGHCSEIINGSISPSKRQEIIDNFSKNDSQYVLAGQIQAGGTGLNIQAASVVVICEPQIKPSLENQAIARAFRMGQSRNVIVHRLCCVDSIDDRMLEILDEKIIQFEAFADRSVSGDESLVLNENDVAIKSAIEEEIKAAKLRHGVIEGQSQFRKSEEGEQWHKEKQSEQHTTNKIIQNQNNRQIVNKEQVIIDNQTKDKIQTTDEKQRFKTIVRDNYRCQLCGRYGIGVKSISRQLSDGSFLTPDGDILEKGYKFATGLEVDYKTTFDSETTNNENSLWTLCDKCNCGRKDRK